MNEKAFRVSLTLRRSHCHPCPRSDASSEEEPVQSVPSIPDLESSLYRKVETGSPPGTGVSSPKHGPPCRPEGTVYSARWRGSPGLPPLALCLLSLTGTFMHPAPPAAWPRPRDMREATSPVGALLQPAVCLSPHSLHPAKHGAPWSTVDIKACWLQSLTFLKLSP